MFQFGKGDTYCTYVHIYIYIHIFTYAVWVSLCVCTHTTVHSFGSAYTAMITVKTIAATMSTTISTAIIHVNGELVPIVGSGSGRAFTVTTLIQGKYIREGSIIASLMQFEAVCSLLYIVLR